jgi:uncharacterized protein (DUF342 family)
MFGNKVLKRIFVVTTADLKAKGGKLNKDEVYNLLDSKSRVKLAMHVAGRKFKEYIKNCQETYCKVATFETLLWMGGQYQITSSCRL